MTVATRRRGQPLAMLGVVLAGWVAVRIALWEPISVVANDPAAISPNPIVAGSFAPVPVVADAASTLELLPNSLDRHRSRLGQASAPKKSGGSETSFGHPVYELSESIFQPPQRRAPMIEPQVAAGHQLMMLAALGPLPLPPSLAASLGRPVDLPGPTLVPGRSRWSGDGWVLVRRGSDGFGTAPSFARYGASQAGAVLRYSLAPGSAIRPQAHLRLTRALVQRGEGEAALGLSLRPPQGLPLGLYGEARVQRVAGETRLRPAATLVSELPPVALPLGARAELYAAAGYVGGRGATPYFDAQLIADRAVAARGTAELRLGAGAWAGGQESAARLDLGPRASLGLKIGEAPSRLAFDWRFRVAGQAAPASGPALTLSAGF